MSFDVLVPRPGSSAASLINQGSGVVPAPNQNAAGDGLLLVYFQGDSPAVNIVTFADRVHQAAGRAATNYPTAAMAAFPPEDFMVAGTFDPKFGEVTLLPDADIMEALLAWLSATALDDAELLTSENSFVTRRFVRDNWSSADPKLRRQAQTLSAMTNPNVAAF